MVYVVVPEEKVTLVARSGTLPEIVKYVAELNENNSFNEHQLVQLISAVFRTYLEQGSRKF